MDGADEAEMRLTWKEEETSGEKGLPKGGFDNRDRENERGGLRLTCPKS
jgi:hypothetical protein